MSGRPRLYFGFRSPYSWLAVQALDEAVPNMFDEIDFMPYWSPDETTEEALVRRGGRFGYQEMGRAKHRYLLLDVKRITEQRGLRVAWPVDAAPRWEVPHLAWLAARREGRAREFYEAVVEARWGRGDNVCDPSVVRAAAEQAGMDPDLAVRAVRDPEIRQEGVECLYRACLDDVFGVPYIRWERHRFWGLDRMQTFLDVWCGGDGTDLSDRWPSIPRALFDEAYSYDGDCAGGCG